MFRILCIFAMWIGWFGHHLIRGKSVAPSTISMTDTIKRTDNMTKMKPLAQVLKEFRGVHGDRYNYKEVYESNYHGNKTVISVICRAHGAFPISVGNHLMGQGCPECAKIKRRISNTGNVRKRTKLVYGVGVNDYKENTKYNHVHIQSYHTWGQMLKRCYSKEFLDKQTTYRGCSVCEEWWSFSNFKKWFDENYIEGYSLDKDILFKGNKIYSPETCCFVPNEINVLLCKSDSKRGKMPIGVCERKMVNGYKYVAYVNNSTKKHFHLGTFDTPEEAFRAYKRAKESHIQEMATQYFNEDKITKKVYDALLNYEVEITD
ncbi:MAG: AP2 domain-containing protein [Acutalibacteraceae bacterium]|nr:AP2 domain-containing protein [Acutalibacteraceae bacterium]